MTGGRRRARSAERGTRGRAALCGTAERVAGRSRALDFRWDEERLSLARLLVTAAARPAARARIGAAFRTGARRPCCPLAAVLGGLMAPMERRVTRRCARSTTGSLSAVPGGCGAGTGDALLSSGAALCAGSTAFCAANSFKGFKDAESPADLGVRRVLN